MIMSIIVIILLISLTLLFYFFWELDMVDIVRGNNLEFLRFRTLCMLKKNLEVVEVSVDSDEN